MGKYLEDFQLNNEQLQEILDKVEKLPDIPSTYKHVASGEATAVAQTSSSPYRRYVKVTGLGFTPSHVALVRKINQSEGFRACFDGVLDNNTLHIPQTTSVSFADGGFEVYHSWSGSYDAVSYACPVGKYAWVAWA